ncbi:MAG TPA: ATP-binding protein [Thermoanaerobaculia bacterium]|nr:ATP-binding protein [Thermoanaerobaculia bacterium]HUM30429.1 ATP-binding protein [Thermoanaerobaculia bacterium]HXK68560.1 ATP-binding protein [Thermoanaerobaculia bacterium]
MKGFPDLSIQRKLMILMVLPALICILIGAVVTMTGDLHTFRKETKRTTELTAKIIAIHSVRDLVFRYRSWSQETLSNLKSLPSIQHAYLYDDQNQLFSAYHRENHSHGAPSISELQSGFHGGGYFVIEPIFYQNERLGTLYLEASTQELRDKIRNYVVIMVLLICFLLAVAFAVAARMRYVISRPILDLAMIARRISVVGDYSLRAEKKGDDEIGALYDGFNAMLNQIQRREADLDEAMNQLSLSEDRIRHIIEQSNDALFVMVGRHFVFANPKFEEYFGYSVRRGDLESMDPLELIAPESKALISELIQKKQEEDAIPQRFTFRGISKQGQIFDFEASVSDIVWNDRPALLGILRDVTEQIETQRRLRDQQATLRLYANELERSNRDLENFAYIASHDLQEPLRKVQAFGDRLRARLEEKLDDPGRDYLERMQGAAERMQRLINDLLAYSRVTSRAQPFVRVELARIADEVLADLEIRIEEAGARVERDALPAIEADPSQIRQLLQNLIGNALKFTRNDTPPIIHIRAKTLEGLHHSGDPMVELSIEDNGIGFDEKYLDRIFTVFQRLHSRKDYPGTGIGLAICRKIAERHGGDITAISREGQGSTFIVRLPLTQPKGGNI